MHLNWFFLPNIYTTRYESDLRLWSNLSSCKGSPEQNLRLQRDLNPWAHGVSYAEASLTCLQRGFIARLVEHRTGIVESWVQIPLKPQILFWAFFPTAVLKLLHNCEDHFHFYSLSAVHIYDLYHMHIIYTTVGQMQFRVDRFHVTSSKPNFYTIHSTKLLLLCFLQFHELSLRPKVWAPRWRFYQELETFEFCNKKPCTSCFWSLRSWLCMNLNISVLETFKSETNKHLK